MDNINELREEDRERLSRILMISRAESGMSQEKTAFELGIAKKTVQNWEKGVSMPTLPQAIAWFRVMKVSAMPYFLQFLFPELEGISSKDSADEIRSSLELLVEVLPDEGIRQLLYILYGDHGTPPRVALNLMTAYLQLPLKERYQMDSQLMCSYRLSKDSDNIARPDHIKPEEDVLAVALEKEREAILLNKDNYMII